MDDLLGEDWKAPPKSAASKPPLNPSLFASTHSHSRASPTPQLSATASPQNISRPSSTLNGGSKTLSGDQFGNLLSLKSQKQASNLSILEQQQRALAEKRRLQEEQSQLWDSLDSGRGTPEVRGRSPGISNGKCAIDEDDGDILAAFDKAAPVNKASFFPPPLSNDVSRQNTPIAGQGVASTANAVDTFDDDDDPFGLGSVPKRANGHSKSSVAVQNTDEDDVLGDLGKPVQDLPSKRMARQSSPNRDETELHNPSMSAAENQDRELAELVDMGFPTDGAKVALAENGGNVQLAVGWLLKQAHEESKRKAHSESTQRRSSPQGSRSPPRRARGGQDSVPSWMQDRSRPSSATRRDGVTSPNTGDKDPAQIAQEFGSKLFKSANTLWKAGQKQVTKTMADFQQERSSSQPKWMQESTPDSSRSNSQNRQGISGTRKTEGTDEAAMLDAPRERLSKATRSDAVLPPTDRTPVEPVPRRPTTEAKFIRQAPPMMQDKRPTSKLTRQDIEEQSAQAYISPARRKKATPKPETVHEPEIDLFSTVPHNHATPMNSSTLKQPQQAPVTTRPSPGPSRSRAPPRNISSVAPSALSTSANHRKAGGMAFKRGDYASAHDSYNAALTPIPSDHPIAIIVLSNRSLTALKTGDAKAAVSDAERALTIIGSSQGVGESIDLGGDEGTKDMREFYGKALMRKAEALEHLEKWADAALAWKAAVEAGFGGAVSLRGKDRCEKAATPQRAAPKPASTRTTVPKAIPPAKSLGNSLQRPTLTSAASHEAVKKLRAANAAAEKADDEKFALTDQVDARLNAWKGGKADNIRALLQSLDGVLWAEAGWKKVGMSDLVLPNKVKIIYMKAISKVHPDKIPQDATTEQRMISGAVFSTLNEAWDKFKKDNNL